MKGFKLVTWTFAVIICTVIMTCKIISCAFDSERTKKHNEMSLSIIYPMDKHKELFAAIEIVEGWQGEDNGIEIGPYQITEAYWRDTDMPGVWWDCERLEYSREVMLRYWSKYKATTDEMRARMHNGGPHGMELEHTKEYWFRVSALMETMQ